MHESAKTPIQTRPVSRVNIYPSFPMAARRIVSALAQIRHTSVTAFENEIEHSSLTEVYPADQKHATRLAPFPFL